MEQRNRLKYQHPSLEAKIWYSSTNALIVKMAQVVKNPCGKECMRHSIASSITGSGRSAGSEEMATHSSVLAWEILQTEELGGLQPMWSHRVRLG